MYEIFDKQKYPVILLILGVLLLLIGFIDIKGITELKFSERFPPIYPLVIFGGVLSLVSIVIYISDELSFSWFDQKKIIKMKNGFGIKTYETEVNILFGKLELISSDSEESLVVLPANEFFDDECIYDNRSALGAYINSKFTNQVEKIEELISKQLKSFKSSIVLKEKGIEQPSFGVGTGVLLKEPLKSKQPLLLLSVTTKRASEGLKAEMSYVFKAVKRIQEITADNRIRSVYIPIMGSGHGGLKKEAALFYLLLAIQDALVKPYGHHIKKYNIVVFQSSEKNKPSISRNVAKRLLKISSGIFS